MQNFSENIQRLQNNDPSLQSLNLDKSSINDEDLLQIMEALLENTSLHSLSLNKVPLNSNIIAALAAVLKNNKSLLFLSLDNTNLNSEKILLLKEGLAANTTLLSFSIGGNKDIFHEDETENQTIALITLIKSNHTLQSLALDKLNMADARASKVLAAIQLHPTLKEVNLANNNLTDDFCKDIQKFLIKNTPLENLKLNKNRIGNAGIKQIAQGLKTNHTLIHLNLAENDIREFGTAYLAHALETNTSLRTLILGSTVIENNVIGEADTNVLARMLSKNHVLETLDFQYIEIWSGIDAIVRGLKRNNALKTLNLSFTYIDDIGGQELASILYINNTLEYLDLSINIIGDLGALSFPSALQKNTGLRSLNFISNDTQDEDAEKITDNTAFAFANVLPELLLTELFLAANSITIKGAEALAAGLEHNYHLNKLTVLSTEELEEYPLIRTYLERNRGLDNQQKSLLTKLYKLGKSVDMEALKFSDAVANPDQLVIIHNLRNQYLTLMTEFYNVVDAMHLEEEPTFEKFRLISAIDDIHQGNLYEAFKGLIYPFQDSTLKSISECWLGEVLLIRKPAFNDFYILKDKIAYYKLIAYSTRNHRDLPHFYIAVASLENPNATEGVKNYLKVKAMDVSDENFDLAPDELHRIKHTVFNMMQGSEAPTQTNDPINFYNYLMVDKDIVGFFKDDSDWDNEQNSISLAVSSFFKPEENSNSKKRTHSEEEFSSSKDSPKKDALRMT